MFALWPQRHVAASDISAPINNLDHQRRTLQREGCVLLPKVISLETCAETRKMIDNLKPIHWDFQGPTDHYKCVFNRDPFWNKFLDTRGVIELVEKELGSNCHIIGMTAWRSHPGHQGAPMHLDYRALHLPQYVLSDISIDIRPHICTAHFYLNNISPELCPTWVVPGSHRVEKNPENEFGRRTQPKEQPVICEAGDVLIFRSDIWHRGSDNITKSDSRYLLQVHYGRREMAQRFSPYISWQFNPEVVKACTPRQLRLLGNHKPAAYD